MWCAASWPTPCFSTSASSPTASTSGTAASSTGCGTWGCRAPGIGPLPAVLVWTVAGIAGSVAVASLSYWALERPLLRLKRLVPASRPMPGEPEAQASTVAITTPDAR